MKKTWNWLKAHKVLTAVTLVLIIGLFNLYIVFYPNPFKITDPDSPFYNPFKYESRDYHGDTEKQLKALKMAMPQGASLQRIESIIKNDDDCFTGHKSPIYEGKINFICSSSPKYIGGQNRTFWFDKDGQLIDYFGSGGRGIYTDKTPEEVWKR